MRKKQIVISSKMRHKIHYAHACEQRLVHYTFDGRPVVHVALSGKSVSNAKKLQLAIKELELSSNALKIILAETNSNNGPAGEEDGILLQSLFFFATTAYAKLFLSTGKGRKKFKPNELYSGEGECFRALDAWWFKVRNDYVAHSYTEPYDDARILLLLDPPHLNSDLVWVVPHVRFFRIPQGDTICNLLKMVEYALSKLRSQQSAVIQHIASEVGWDAREKYIESAVDFSACPEMPPAPGISADGACPTFIDTQT